MSACACGVCTLFCAKSLRAFDLLSWHGCLFYCPLVPHERSELSIKRPIERIPKEDVPNSNFLEIIMTSNKIRQVLEGVRRQI